MALNETVLLRKLHKTQFERLLDRDGPRCFYCEEWINPSELTIDHVFPKSKGGGYEISNLVLACGPCNSGKGDRAEKLLDCIRELREQRAALQTEINYQGRLTEDYRKFKKESALYQSRLAKAENRIKELEARFLVQG